jgi:hypothetical protein
MTIAALAAAGSAALLLLAFATARLTVARRLPWRLHEFLVLWVAIYWLGAFTLMFVEEGASATAFATIASIALGSATAGALVALALALRREVPAPAPVGPGELRAATIGGVVSALVCAAFVAAVLRNEELALLLAAVVTGDGSFLEYRLTMSTGGALYLAPGYVKQFRDVLLPTALVTLAASGATRARWLVPALSAFGLAAAVLSGERFVIMIHIFAAGAAYMLRPQRRGRVGVVAPVVAGAAIFAAFVGATVLLGRAEGVEGFGGLIVATGKGLFERVIVAAPRENSLGFLVWGAAAPTWGETWAADLAGILPGVQVNLSNELHELLGGSAQGASPLGLPADLFLAWGHPGVALLPCAFVLALHALDDAVLRSRLALAHIFRLLLVPLTFAWYSPFLFVLNGGLVLVGAAVVLGLRRRE